MQFIELAFLNVELWNCEILSWNCDGLRNAPTGLHTTGESNPILVRASNWKIRIGSLFKSITNVLTVWLSTDRICVVDEALASCLNMVSDTAPLNLEFECVRSRDRYQDTFSCCTIVPGWHTRPYDNLSPNQRFRKKKKKRKQMNVKENWCPVTQTKFYATGYINYQSSFICC